jgi:hypothetical protein
MTFNYESAFTFYSEIIGMLLSKNKRRISVKDRIRIVAIMSIYNKRKKNSRSKIDNISI